MLCRVCGRMNREDDLYCGSCGQKLMRARVCRVCGGKNRPDSGFCGACGSALAEEPATCGRCGGALGARDHFCGRCGLQVLAGRQCPRCHMVNRPDARFCVVCGDGLAVESGVPSRSA